MGRKRKMPCCRLSLILMSLLFVCAPANVFGAQTGGFLESCEASEGEVKIYCTDFLDETQIFPEQFTAVLGSQEVAVTDVSTAAQEDVPLTVYCLVDVSGSMKEEQMAQAKEILTSVCSGLQENDNMVIGSLGNDLSASDYLTDKNEIQAMIDSLLAGNEDTNLYQGIVNSLQTLKESSKANRKKCLLILSDGKDEHKSGITQNEAEAAVRNSLIPVYTAATLRSSQSDEEIESAKLLGSFARISSGGRDYAPMIDGADAAAVGEEILSSLRNGIILTLDTSQVEINNKDTLLLRVVHTSENQSVIEDTMEIFTQDLVFAEQENEDLMLELEEDTEIISQPEPKPAFPWLVIAGIVVVVAAVIIIFIIVLAKKNKHPSEEAGETEDSGEEKKTADVSWQPFAVSGNRSAAQKEKKAVCEVRFTAIGYENVRFVLQMEEGRILTLGRDKRADLILNPEDRRLSSVHCKVQCMGNQLRIWDMDSTNGTFVNGVSLKKIGTAVIDDEQSVRMGSYEYRITVRNGGV